MVENPRFAVGILVISLSYRTVVDISTSGLDCRIAISGYSSMPHLFVDTFFEFDIVENCFSR